MRKSRFLDEEAPIDVYLADNQPCIEYPLRVQSVNHISPTTVSHCRHSIVDSNIGDESIDNQSVIETAENYGVETVVPCDVIGDYDETVSQIRDMAVRIEKSETVENMFAPIQGTSVEEYAMNANALHSTIESSGLGEFVYTYAIGGIKDIGTDKQIEHAKAIREMNSDMNLHLFGGGMSMKWIKTLRENPNLIDSLDMSTPVHMSFNGKIVMPNMQRLDTDLPRGTHSSRPKAQMVEYMCTMYNFLISDGPDEADMEVLYEQNDLL